MTCSLSNPLVIPWQVEIITIVDVSQVDSDEWADPEFLLRGAYTRPAPSRGSGKNFEI